MRRPRHWVCHEIQWARILKSQAELKEIEAFKNEVIARTMKIADPFWCLESNSAVDSNYVSPEVVKKMATVESEVGLFRKLFRRDDLEAETKALARDLAGVGLLIELAAHRDLALYFREDGT